MKRIYSLHTNKEENSSASSNPPQSKNYFPMKKGLIFYGLALLTMITFFGCKAEPSIPSLDEMTTSTVNLQPTMTIKDFLTKYFTSTMAVDTIQEDVILSGTVVSDHWNKNFYGQFYVQDNTGGIQIRMGSPMYEVGQNVFIVCKGFILGQYGGMPQLGALYNGGVGYLSTVAAKECILENGAPVNVVPTPITSKVLTANLGRLVQFTNVTFATSSAGKSWSASGLLGGSYNNIFTDGLGNSITTRTDQNAVFRNAIIPTGKGTVVGVLSIYGSTYQLNIRDMNDLTNFK
jgi:hypothetical protein